nr:homoprotocatechuate degradation operon regulator HpaR [Bradyrhizobium mercantei]
MREFSQSLPMALLRAREAVMKHFRPALRQSGLTEQQWRVLRALAWLGEIEITELARTVVILGPSLSRILRDLEARRFIERRTPETDLRRTVVTIAAEGMKLIDAVAPASEAIYASIARRVGEGRLSDLHDMLGVLERSLDGKNAVRPPKPGTNSDE